MTAPPDVEALLAETRWLGGLARRVVGNGADADDLVQATLMAAVERPPSPGRPLRGWLAAVLRNLRRDDHRSSSARSDRERAKHATTATAPPAADVVAKAEAHRELVAAVLALEEPYRTCVLLRFFENLPPRAIARRTATPIATVSSRLQHALALLRARLARTHGSRWQLGLAPLLTHGDGTLSFLFGVSLVHTLGKIALGATILVVATLIFAWPSTPQYADPPAPRRDGTNPIAAGANTTDGAVAANTVRREEATPRTDGRPASPSAERRLRGRVLDVHGSGIAGVALAFGGERERAAVGAVTSAAGGSFDVATPAGATTIASSDPRWATVLAGSARIAAEQQCTVVVAPRLELGGRVVDRVGAPLPGAAVSAHMPAQLGADLGVLLDFSTPREWRAVCDRDGRFRLSDVPAVAAASLIASLGGYEPRIVEVPAASTELLELVLERPSAHAALLSGVVIDAWGAAVAGARVSAGADIAISDARGTFALDIAGKDVGTQLVAIARGMQPAVFTPERAADGQPAWPGRVVLQLGPPPKLLVGRVTFADGRPVKGAKVWIVDPLFVGVADDVVLAETMLAGRDGQFWAFVVAGDGGAFRLDGLLDREYAITALDPSTLLQTTSAGVRAGRTDVELRIDGALHARLRGRVVARDGTPIPDVDVLLQRPGLEVRVPGGTRDQWATGAKTHTDENGAFSFTDVPADGVEVFASGDTIMFAGRTIRPGIDPLAFDVVVDRRMHLQIEVAPPTDRADQVRVLDAAGEAMLLRIMRGNAARTARSAAITDGRSHILSLGEGARTVVLLRDGKEVGRQPVQLTAGQVTTVRF